jgi:hypothetical protein
MYGNFLRYGETIQAMEKIIRSRRSYEFVDAMIGTMTPYDLV